MLLQRPLRLRGPCRRLPLRSAIVASMTQRAFGLTCYDRVGVEMGIFGIIIAVCAVVWLIGRWFGRPETEKCAEDAGARAIRGAHRVGTEFLGGIGGQGTPDFSRQVDEFEPEGQNVARVDEP
jgi:hypothetical protein